MNLYTIQNFDAIVELLTTGKFFCDPEKSPNLSNEDKDISAVFKRAYNWLVPKIKEKIGAPRKGIKYPVWAWYANEDSSIDWRKGAGEVGEIMYRIDFIMDEKDVIATDFEKWHAVIGDCILTNNEDEYHYWSTLNKKERESYKRKTWNRIFTIEKDSVCQYNFWELDYKNVINITPFVVPDDDDEDEEEEIKKDA